MTMDFPHRVDASDRADERNLLPITGWVKVPREEVREFLARVENGLRTMRMGCRSNEGYCPRAGSSQRCDAFQSQHPAGRAQRSCAFSVEVLLHNDRRVQFCSRRARFAAGRCHWQLTRLCSH
jgi:hypothetical protein